MSKKRKKPIDEIAEDKKTLTKVKRHRLSANARNELFSAAAGERSTIEATRVEAVRTAGLSRDWRLRVRGSRELSASQNHIISDHNLGNILENILNYARNENDRRSSSAEHPITDSLRNFLQEIFSNQQILNQVNDRLDNFLDRANNAYSADVITSFIVSRADKNLFVGNASANSAIGENLDAPRNRIGAVRSGFNNILDLLFDLSRVVITNLDSSNQRRDFQEMLINSLTPNYVSRINRSTREIRASATPIVRNRNRTQDDFIIDYFHQEGNQSDPLPTIPEDDELYIGNRNIENTMRNISDAERFHRSNGFVRRVFIDDTTIDYRRNGQPSENPSPKSSSNLKSATKNQSRES